MYKHIEIQEVYMKKIISLFICIVVVCGAVPCVFAYEFPSEFWGLKSEYEPGVELVYKHGRLLPG